MLQPGKPRLHRGFFICEMTNPHRLRGYAFVLVAATLWATLGIIFKALIGD